jgi:hypothetical protein
MEETNSLVDASGIIDTISAATPEIVAVGMAALSVLIAIKTIKWFRSAA